jgi:hypothetical protein
MKKRLTLVHKIEVPSWSKRQHRTVAVLPICMEQAERRPVLKEARPHQSVERFGIAGVPAPPGTPRQHSSSSGQEGTVFRSFGVFPEQTDAVDR